MMVVLVLIIVVMLLMVVLFLMADALGGEYCIVIRGRCVDGDGCVGDVNGYGDCCVVVVVVVVVIFALTVILVLVFSPDRGFVS
jgi:hypothetical protein